MTWIIKTIIKRLENYELFPPEIPNNFDKFHDFIFISSDVFIDKYQSLSSDRIYECKKCGYKIEINIDLNDKEYYCTILHENHAIWVETCEEFIMQKVLE